MSPEDLAARGGAYYSGKTRAHGATPAGMDWNGEESQPLRFAQLLSAIDRPGPGEINEVGCGYGALIDARRSRGLSNRDTRCYV